MQSLKLVLLLNPLFVVSVRLPQAKRHPDRPGATLQFVFRRQEICLPAQKRRRREGLRNVVREKLEAFFLWNYTYLCAILSDSCMEQISLLQRLRVSCLNFALKVWFMSGDRIHRKIRTVDGFACLFPSFNLLDYSRWGWLPQWKKPSFCRLVRTETPRSRYCKSRTIQPRAYWRSHRQIWQYLRRYW